MLIILDNARNLTQEIQQFNDECFFDVDGRDSHKKKLETLLSDIQDEQKKIGEYQQLLFDGDSEKTSIQSRIAEALETATSKADTISSKLDESRDELAGLSLFYDRVFGYEKDGKQVQGLQAEFTDRKEEFSKYYEKIQNKYDALYQKIEELLPSATSAGLAKAFSDQKKSYKTAILVNSWVFYAAAILILVTAIMLGKPLFMGSPFSLEGISVGTVSTDAMNFSIQNLQLLKNTLIKLPIFIPLFWIAFFASKRRSQAQRLQEEYAHKEAIAMSYSSFKTQIEELEQEEQELLKKLLETAIYTIGYNASSTLDGKHGDESPVMQIMAKMNPFRNSQVS